MFKFLYIALIIILIAGIIFAGWKFRGKRNSHKMVRDNAAWEASLNKNQVYREKQIVFFGNSEIALWPMQSSFGVLPFKNRGLSGDLVTQCLKRYKDEVISLSPDAIVLLMGTNDLNDGISTSDILKSIQALIDEGEQTGAEIIVCSLLPVNSDVADAGRPVSSILEINKSLSKICLEQGLEFVDFYEFLLDDEEYFDKRFTDDGLHPNKEGYLIMSHIILPYILKIQEGI